MCRAFYSIHNENDCCHRDTINLGKTLVELVSMLSTRKGSGGGGGATTPIGLSFDNIPVGLLLVDQNITINNNY